MGGGHELISYAETEISGTKTESGSVSNYGFYVTSTSRSGSAMPDNRGVLQYKIDCTSDKSNFVVNTLLRNSGVTKADGTAITASDVNGKISTDALQIKGGENFFKKTGGSDLAKFSLSADWELDSELATELRKFDFTQEKINEFYDDCNKDTKNSYLEMLYDGSGNFTVDDLKAIKAEAERLIPIADNCVTALGNYASQYLKDLLELAKKFNNSVTGDNLDQFSSDVADAIKNDTANSLMNRGRLLFAAIDISMHIIQDSAYIVIDNSSKVNQIRESQNYKNIMSMYEQGERDEKNLSSVFVNDDSDYTAIDIVLLVCVDQLNFQDYSTIVLLDSLLDESSKFEWLANWVQMYKNLPYIKVNLEQCLSNSSNLHYTFYFSYSGTYKNLTPSYLTDDVINILSQKSSADLTLNSGTPTTDAQTVQDGNTYQIFETTDQKLYWDSDKLVFEIPIELPEKTTDNSTITGFKLTCEENPEYLAVATATE